MSLDLTDMRELLREGLGGLDSQDLPDVEADRLLNMALWELEDRFPFKEKETRDTTSIVLVDGTAEYTLPTTLDALMGVSVLTLDGNSKKLTRMSEAFYEENFNTDPDHEGFPERYLRRDDKLVLWPTPDQVYPIHLTFWKTVASLVLATDAPDLPRNWHELVIEGGIVRGHFYAQDYNLGQQAMNFQVTKERGAVMRRSKEEKFDSRYAGLRPISEESDLEEN